MGHYPRLRIVLTAQTMTNSWLTGNPNLCFGPWIVGKACVEFTPEKRRSVYRFFQLLSSRYSGLVRALIPMRIAGVRAVYEDRAGRVCIRHARMHTMKNRVTLTMDPEIAKKAKQIAHARRTSVSALIEDLLRAASISATKQQVSFADKWTGKLRLRTPTKPDPRFEALKKRYGLD